MERETGIEPATNSLEGCDSTTELLPLKHLEIGQSGHLESCIARTVAACDSRRPRLRPHARSPDYPLSRFPNSPLVAREGLEPSKAQGRQIYSLLRLTASLPRRCVVWLKFPASPAVS